MASWKKSTIIGTAHTGIKMAAPNNNSPGISPEERFHVTYRC